MKFLNKIIRGIDGIISTIATSILLVLMAFGIYALYDVYDVYNSALLQEDIITLHPKEKSSEFDFSQLKEINSDIIGWITLNNTNIDYPILLGKDNTVYLNKNYKGEYSATGSIFMDYRNDSFQDDYSIIYGHNMNANLMFGDIKNYKDYSFFKNHLDGVLYTEEGRFKLTVMTYAMTSAYDKEVYNLTNYKNGRNVEVMHHIQSIATYNNEEDFELKEGEKLLLLSTCDAQGVNERSILLTKIEEVEEDVELGIQSNEENTVKNKKTIFSNADKGQEIKLPSMRTLLLIIFSLVTIIICLIAFSNYRKQKKKAEKKRKKTDTEIDIL